MKFYLAPMEGVTGFVYRNAYHTYFGDIDKYFTPFIAPSKNKCLTSREKNDILPEHNKNMCVVPQILTNQAEHFIATTKVLEEFGYQEVNLNLGCPSGTVVSKFKGAGFLAKKDELNQFLEQIYNACSVDISIKTRVGIDNPEEFYDLLKIYNQYPVKELIIHPRVRNDFYKNKPNWDILSESVQKSKNPLCYNGDIFTPEMYKKFKEAFPAIDTVMLGRGIIVNPNLAGEIKTGHQLDKITLRKFHDTLLTGYQELLSGDKNVLFKMKELWFYMIHVFSNHEKYAKKIKKSQSLSEYKIVISNLFEEQEMVEADKRI